VPDRRRTSPWRDPLLHFAVAGLVAAALLSMGRPTRRVVRWDAASEAMIVESLTASLGRAPTQEELGARRRLAIEREILVREALARGLAEGDPVIRRRLLDKMEVLLLAEGRAASECEGARAGSAVTAVRQTWHVAIETCKVDASEPAPATPEAGPPGPCRPDPHAVPAGLLPLERVRRSLGDRVADAVERAAAAGHSTWQAVAGTPWWIRVLRAERRSTAAGDPLAEHRDRAARDRAARARALEAILARYDVRGVP